LAAQEPTNIATKEEVRAFEQSLTNGRNQASIPLTPEIYRKMHQSETVKVLDATICQDNRDYSRPGVDHGKNINLCQESGFLPENEALKDDRGRICLPIQYSIHKEGHMIASHRSWSKLGVKAKLKKGTHEIIGMTSRKQTDGMHRVSYLLRSYIILRPLQMKCQGYQYVNLYDESAAGHHSLEHLGAMVLATFRENRPDGYVVDHLAAKDNDSLDCIIWATISQNNQEDRRAPRGEANEFYTMELQPMNNDIHPSEKWYCHPVLDIKVNEDGTHVKRTTDGKLLQVRHRVYTKTTRVDVKVCVERKDCLLNRIALECFLGRVLEAGEVSDHINRDRTDNSKSNLRARHRLFNANNKGVYSNNKTGVKGVSFDEKNNCYIASIPVQLPVGPSTSMTKQASFSVKRYGEEGARNQAVAWRKLHYLQTDVTL
jgi:hypothetical protein